MRYFDAFSGIGGFPLGIKQAYEVLCNANGSENRGSEKDTARNQGQRLQPKEGKKTSTSQRPVSERNNNQSNKRPLCIGYSEIDKYATQIYQRHFPNHKNYGDITKINAEELPDFDLLAGGFPCQAFSIAGKRGGFEDTRGTMFFELARILRAKQPRLFVFENVKGLLSHDGGKSFATIIQTLDELGYDCQWQVLNSKNHGVPQNRERVFIIGHLRRTPRPEVFPFGESIEQVTRKPEFFRVNKIDRSKQYYNLKKDNQSGALTATMYKGIDASGRTGAIQNGKIRRLTPTECERLQGFPDGWTEKGLSDIMEICVNINNVNDKQLLKLDIASNTTSDGNGMVIQTSLSTSQKPVNIVLKEQLLEVGAINTTNLGKDMVMLFNRNETLQNAEQIKKSHTCGKTEENCTCKLWSVNLDEDYERERLFTILTWTNEIMNQATSTCAKTEQNIIGVIIHLNSQEQNSLNEELLHFKVGNIGSISDTQRYKTLGNAVTVNVIRDIFEKLL